MTKRISWTLWNPCIKNLRTINEGRPGRPSPSSQQENLTNNFEQNFDDQILLPDDQNSTQSNEDQILQGHGPTKNKNKNKKSPDEYFGENFVNEKTHIYKKTEQFGFLYNKLHKQMQTQMYKYLICKINKTPKHVLVYSSRWQTCIFSYILFTSHFQYVKL